MTPTEAATLLRKFNEWRRGAWGDDHVPYPPFPPITKEIGLAIDAAIKALEKQAEVQAIVAQIKNSKQKKVTK